MKDEYILPQNKEVDKKATCGYKTVKYLDSQTQTQNINNCICTNTNHMSKDWCCKRCY